MKAEKSRDRTQLYMEFSWQLWDYLALPMLNQLTAAGSCMCSDHFLIITFDTTKTKGELSGAKYFLFVSFAH